MISPIFILSLPRSGSTLLQRILTTHPKVASTSEPWLLLPLIYSYRAEGSITEYSHINCASGVNNFIQALPNKMMDYDVAIRKFVVELYDRQCSGNELYFLDKTPRYHLIIEDLFRIFPEAKFIFLFREPLHILSSIISTYSKGTLRKLYTHTVDFKRGISNLSEGFQKHSASSIAVFYEQMIYEPDETFSRIFDYLGLEYNREAYSSFGNIKFQGNLGDPGYDQKNHLNTESMEKWRSEVVNPIRKKLYKQVLMKIPDDNYFFQFKSKQTQLQEIETAEVSSLKFVFRDAYHLIYNFVYLSFRPQLYFGRFFRKWTRGININ